MIVRIVAAMLAVIIQAGKRSIDESLHASPACEKRVSPKTDRGQMIAVNRTSDHFRDHVIGGAEPDRAEPKEKKIIREPPIHCGLHDSLHRNDKQHDLRRGVEPREPEKRAEQIPLRDVNVLRRGESGT